MRERAREIDTGWVGAGADDDLDHRLAEEVDAFDLGQPHVMTVLGPIEPAALGVALVDERVAADPPEAVADPDLRLDDVHAALAELEDAYAAGGRAVVDGATPDRGRDAAALRWVAARAPVHLVAVAGRDRSFASTARDRDTLADDLAAEFAREITEGIAETGVRAGAIVAGLAGGPPAPSDVALLRGAARARALTGAPFFLRAPRVADALDGFAILQEEGVDTPRVVAGGFSGRPDGPGLRTLLDLGARVAFDRLGDDRWPAAEQAAALRDLVDAGHGGQIVLSAGLVRRSSLRVYGGGPGWVGTLERFPLLLMEAGLDAPAVRRLLVDNPARALTIGPEEG